MKIRLTPRALADAKRLKGWWARNRKSAPDLFEQELEEALARLAAMPTLGPVYEHEGREVGVRRFLLRKTGHHVYYAADTVDLVVIAIWGARKARGPRL